MTIPDPLPFLGGEGSGGELSIPDKSVNLNTQPIQKMKSYQQIAGDGTTDRALSQYEARVAELEAEGCTTSDAQSVADAERQNYPRFEVRTDAADKIGDHIEGYGEKLVSVHSTEDEAEKALPKAQKAAWHGHNRAQVWKVVNEGTALGGAQITW